MLAHCHVAGPPDKLSPIRTYVAQQSNDSRPTSSVTQNRRGRGLWRSKHGLTLRVKTAFLRTNIEIWPIAKSNSISFSRHVVQLSNRIVFTSVREK